jgi:hypothetical protein
MLVIAQLAILSTTLVQQSVAADPPGFVLWSKGIPPGDPNSKVSFPNHTLSISQRDKDGLVEVHEKFADVIAIQVGNATLIVGGEVVEPASIEAGEIRGKSIQGGIRRTGSRGDVIHIGAGTPHQFLMAPGEQITYILVKIAALLTNSLSKSSAICFICRIWPRASS